MIKFLSKTILIGLGALALTGFALAYYNPGQPSGFVNDYTGTLTADQKRQLEDKLNQFEKTTGHEISVVFIDTLKDDTIENFAVELFKEWGIGKQGTDNGVLILVAKDDRQMRVEVGYGLEGSLTDAQSYWIVDDVMKPAFQAGDFYQGVDGAVNKIISAIGGEELPSQSSNSGSSRDWEMIFGLIIFGIMWLGAILGRSKSWWFGGVLGAVVGLVVALIKGFVYFGLISVAILIPVGLLFDYIVSRQYQANKNKDHLPWWIGGGKGGGFGSGGGFGGFGGGLSGGGGASGRW